MKTAHQLVEELEAWDDELAQYDVPDKMRKHLLALGERIRGVAYDEGYAEARLVYRNT